MKIGIANSQPFQIKLIDFPMRFLNISSSATTASAQTSCSHYTHASSLSSSVSFPHLYHESSSNISIPHNEQSTTPQKPKTIRYRLSKLCSEGHVNLARQLFDEIPKPNTVVWNALLIGYICNDLHDEAINLYSRMKWSCGFYKLEPDPYTFSSVLKACAERRDIRVGEAVHCHVLRSSIYPGRIVYNSLLNMYVSCLSNDNSLSSFNLVEKMFESMPKRNVVAWNTMISWYSKMEKPIEALLKFVKMMKMGVEPTLVSFINVFPAASRMRDFKTADILYGLVLKSGNQYIHDLYVVSSAISMYAELGCIDIARKVFDNCSERNSEILNCIIGGYVQNSLPSEAIDLFIKALEGDEDDVSLDDLTFLSAISAASQLQQLGFVKQVHAYMIKNSLISCITIANASITMYSKCSSIDESFRIFYAMPGRDLVSWNSMVSALVQNGMDDEALMLVYDMLNQGFKVDAVTITGILSAASNIGHQEIGKQTHGYIVRHGIKFEGMNTYLIDMYAKSGNVCAAEKIFELNGLSDRDPATWNAMISGHVHNGLIDQSFNIFKQMLDHRVTPTAVTLSSILPACSVSGSLSNGKACHGFVIRRFIDANVFLTSALVDMYSKTGSLRYAETVFEISTEKNNVTYTNMILGYGQHGMADKAIELFHLYREAGYENDGIVHLAALSACCHAGRINDGLEIFELLRKDNLKPSLEHYACVVDMLGRVGRVDEAYNILQEFDESCNAPRIWGSILAACSLHRNYVLGKVVADKLIRMNGGHMAIGHAVLISNVYAAEGNWEVANRVRNSMKRKGLVKEVGCSWIDISGYTYSFVSKGENNVMYSELYDHLGHLTKNMKDAVYNQMI